MKKIWLDDLRTPPDASWLWAKTAPEAVDHLANGRVERISLNHDLGNDTEGTGYTVASWLEECGAQGLWELVPSTILVHSANPVGIQKMLAAIRSIDRLRQMRADLS